MSVETDPKVRSLWVVRMPKRDRRVKFGGDSENLMTFISASAKVGHSGLAEEAYASVKGVWEGFLT